MTLRLLVFGTILSIATFTAWFWYKVCLFCLDWFKWETHRFSKNNYSRYWLLIFRYLNMKMFYWYDKIFILFGLSLITIPFFLKVIGYSINEPFIFFCNSLGLLMLGIEFVFFLLFVFITYLSVRGYKR